MAASAKHLAITLCLLGLLAGSACALKYQIQEFGGPETNQRVLLLRMDLIYHPTPSPASDAPSPPKPAPEERYRASPEVDLMEIRDKIPALLRVCRSIWQRSVRK